jgi:transposase InsO family protein
VCRRYLLERGIKPELVEELISDGTVVHNRHEGRSYCTFAVRDKTGQLKCLDNHAVEGSGKFVLGSKSPFSREWEALEHAKVVFLTEGIIDYLSVKTLEGTPPPGLALLGNQLCFAPALLEQAEVLLSAMDDDRGGNSAVLDLKITYPDKEVRIYDLEGYKDPNELLVAVRSGKGRRLSPERKMQLYREFQLAENKAELAARWGIDRSHLYEIVRDCEAALVGALASRKVGRPPKGKPTTLAEALERIEQLERQYEQEATRREEQAYMLYHELGYVGMKSYDRIKRQVKRLLGQEVAQRKLLLPAPDFYEHVRAEKSGEIWAEDFTDVTVQSRTFKVAVLLDTYDNYYLGQEVATRATAALVASPVDQALEKTGGRGPEKFLLSDNGSQYISAAHGDLLTSAEIVQRRIPASVPQYNGCVEGGMRELKSVFYNVWERRSREKNPDEEENLLQQVETTVHETVTLMNESIPRPALGGVTPADVHMGNKEARRGKIAAYRAREESKQDVPPWKRSYWDVLKAGLRADLMSNGELLTKLDFFCRRPLRRIAQRNQEGVG